MGILPYHHPSDHPMAKLTAFIIVCLMISPIYAEALSLDDAVKLTLKNNFDITAAKLERTNQKFAVKVSKDAFAWQNSIIGESTILDSTSDTTLPSSTSVSPQSSIKSVYGTEFTFLPHFSLTGEHIEPEIIIKQNLIRGIHPDVNTADLKNAISQNEIDKLNYRNTISNAISQTIINYIAIISTNHKIASYKRTLKVNRNNLENSKLRFQLGEQSKTDIVNNRISVAQTLSNLASAKSEREKKIGELLKAINIARGDITIHDQLTLLKEKYTIPSKTDAKKALLKNNVDYQTLKLNLIKNKRNLIKAKDDLKVDLSIIGSAQAGDTNESTVKFTLDAPIHNVNKEQAVVNAKIAIKTSEYAIKSKQLELENRAKDYIAELNLLQESLDEQKKELNLRIDILKANQIRYRSGTISQFQLIEEINNKEQAMDQYTDMMINFATKIVNLYNEMGITLEQWHVNLPKDY